MLSPGTSCGRCRACLSGEDNACRHYRILGAQLHGGYAELVRCPLPNLIPLPDSISFEAAAAFPLVFLTAWRMLVTRARVRPGEDVLVWAAGSGVGMAAIQVAKHWGARVIATAGTAVKLGLARSLGADAVLDHHQGDVLAEIRRLTNKKGVEVVIEHVGQATWERSIQALAHRGRLGDLRRDDGAERRDRAPLPVLEAAHADGLVHGQQGRVARSGGAVLRGQAQTRGACHAPPHGGAARPSR